jgi:rhomboid protease GluP
MQNTPPDDVQGFPGTPLMPPPKNPLNRVSYPTVTYTILGITLLIFLLQMLTETLLQTDLPALWGMKENSLIVQGQVWRLLTPVFLHGSILHIGFNMYALWIIGGRMERVYGHGKFIVLYFLSAYTGNVFSFLFQPSPSLGASTAIFGLLAAEGVLLYQNRKLIHDARSMLQNIITIGVINLIIGTTGGIDNWGHLGGLLGGAAFGWFAGPLLDAIPYGGGYALVDRRSQREVVIAFLLVFLSFTALAVIGMMDPFRHFSLFISGVNHG